MAIMRWCTVQTNEYDLQTKMCPNICTRHKLHNNNENNSRFSQNVHAINDRIWCNSGPEGILDDAGEIDWYQTGERLPWIFVG